MEVYGIITGTLTAPGKISGSLSAAGNISGTVTIPSAILPPAYEGEYEVAPSEEEQVLATAELLMLENVTISAIPSNYGLITRVGSVLTIS